MMKSPLDRNRAEIRAKGLDADTGHERRHSLNLNIKLPSLNLIHSRRDLNDPQ